MPFILSTEDKIQNSSLIFTGLYFREIALAHAKERRLLNVSGRCFYSAVQTEGEKVGTEDTGSVCVSSAETEDVVVNTADAAQTVLSYHIVFSFLFCLSVIQFK